MFQIYKQFLFKYNRYIIPCTILQLLATICTLYLPNMNAHIIDNGVVKGDIGYIYTEGTFMVLFSLLQITLTLFATYLGAKSAFMMARDIRKEIFDKVQTYSTIEMHKFGVPTLITRVTNDVQQIQMFTTFIFSMILTCPMMFIGGIVMSIEQDLPLSGVIAGTLPVIVIIILIFAKKITPLFRSFQKKVDKLNLVFREQISGVRVVRAFTKEKAEENRFEEVNDELYKLNITTGKAMTLLFPIFMFVINLAMLAIMWFGGIRVDSGEMEIGAITAFINYMMYIMMAVLMSSMVLIMMPRSQVSSNRISKVLETSSSLKNYDNQQFETKKNAKQGDVEFKNVSFSYSLDSEKVLNSISFTAKQGETTAIVGSTGSGKTSLLNLIPRLYDCQDGEVLVGGKNTKGYKKDELNALISYTPQKAYLFKGTVGYNLKFGREGASKEEVENAIEIARATSFLQEKAEETGTDILDIEVSQGGNNFSGGQKQRLAIARSLVKNPKIYLFDDSFSALDYKTDRELREKLNNEVKDSTKIIVAQRISTIQDADKIIVIDKGRIVGEGKHSELLSECETYKEIVISQISKDEAAKIDKGSFPNKNQNAGEGDFDEKATKTQKGGK